MEYKNLLLEEKEGILTATINREKAMNALNNATMLELHHLFSVDAPHRAQLKGIIITGAGDRAFVAGADIKEFLSLDAMKGEAMAHRGQDIFFYIEQFPKPVIALVNGYTLGAGCELAMACHLRVATTNASFGQPEVNLGIIPGYGGTQRLIQYIGKGKALELLMTGDMIDANEAHRLGLVNYVLEKEAAQAKVQKLMKKITSKGPKAIAKIIESVNAYFKHNVNGYSVELESFGYAAGTEDFKEGAQAFIEKRKPNFKGS